MKAFNGSWETSTVTAGSWFSAVAEVSALSLIKLWWNESLSGSDNILVYMRDGTSSESCSSNSWSSAYTDPNGVSIAAQNPNTWIQLKVDFTATDTTVTNPKLYSAGGFVIKYSYSKGFTAAESSVEFIYETGYRHFNQPDIDKIWKKIVTWHSQGSGSFVLDWTTENATGSFLVFNDTYPERFSSYFQDNAMGKKITFKIYKNDMNDMILREISGFYTPEPLII
jgi:hypothetical protein